MLIELKKSYQIQTYLTKAEILNNLRNRKDVQINSISFLDFIDYRNVKLSGNIIEFRRNSSIFNTNQRQWTIFFKLEQLSVGTRIKCVIDPFSEDTFLTSTGICLCFLIMFSVGIYLASNHNNGIILIMSLWICALIGIWLAIKYQISILQEFSKTILIDLGVKG